jgi:hypothetical protein
MDLDFDTNLSRCLRYYQKSYDYATKAGTATTNGAITIAAFANSHPAVPVAYPKRLAKVATPIAYSTATGAINTIRDSNAGVDRSVTGIFNAGESGFGGFLIGSFNASATNYYGQYTIDTGW